MTAARAAAAGPKGKPACTHCSKPTARRHPILDIPLCRPCQGARKDTYQYVTKTRAMREYRLKAGDLAALRTHAVDNPHYKISHPMQLYLLSQVERASAEKWGSAEPYTVALREFSAEFLAWLDEEPGRIASLTPEKFQYLVADRLEQLGLAVQPVGRINRKDGAIDLVAYPRGGGVPFLLAVQAKHHRAGNSTGVEKVREFHGSLASNGSPFHIGMVVTNTAFTPDARWFADQNRRLVRLRDLQDLRRWLKDDYDNEFEWREIPDRIVLAPGVEIAIPRQGLFVPKPPKLILPR